MTVSTPPKGPARVAWLFGLAFTLLIVISWSSMTLISRELANARAAHVQVLGTRDLMAELENVLSLLRDAETGERGYVITDDTRFLQPFESAHDNLEHHLQKLEASLGEIVDDDSLRNLLARSRVQMEFLTRVVELQREHKSQQAVDLIRTQIGKHQMDEIRRLVATLEREQQRLLAARIQSFTRSSIDSEKTVKQALIAAVLLVLAASMLLFRYAHRRLLAERAAEDASELLRSTMDNITEGVVVYDKDMRVLSWNPRFLELRRLDVSDIGVGMPCKDLMRSAEPLAVRVNGVTYDTRSAEPGFGLLANAFEGEATGSSGKILRMWAAPLANGNFIVTISDITALRHSEEAFRDQATRLNATLDNVVDAIITINHAGIIESFSKGAERLFGYSTEEVLHQNIKMLMPPHHAHAHDGYLNQHLMTGERRVMGQRRQVEALHKDGRRIPVDLGVSEMKIGDRRLFVGIVRDISERMEIDLMKSGFVSTVSHELRTPLTSIGGSLSLLMGGAGGALSTKALKLIDIAKQNSDRLVNLINDILDLERAESGKLDLQLEDQLLVPIVEQAVELNRGYAHSYGVSIKFESNNVDCKVAVDRDRFIQVLTNLVANAVKYSPTAGVVTVRTDYSGRKVRVSVQDEGPGVPAAFEKRIFHKFSQADSSDTRAKGGTGLGLSIVKTFMDRFNGEVDFERGREKGTGAKFYVTLPIVQAAAPAVVAAEDSSTPPHILICEDDPQVAELLTTVLSDAGMTVGKADTADTARTALKVERFDLLLIDVNLPDANGLDVVKEVRDDQEKSTVPVIVMTGGSGEAREQDNVKALRLSDWLQKPIRPERLVEAIRSALLAHQQTFLRVLHVEDDESLTEVVQTLLEDSVHIVSEHSISAARVRIEKETFDLVILDVSLGDGSGLDLLPMFQKIPNPPAVVLYTANEPSREVAAKVQGVIVKSRHSVSELLASVRNISEAKEGRGRTAA